MKKAALCVGYFLVCLQRWDFFFEYGLEIYLAASFVYGFALKVKQRFQGASFLPAGQPRRARHHPTCRGKNEYFFFGIQPLNLLGSTSDRRAGGKF
jgi:hypothetical protein